MDQGRHQRRDYHAKRGNLGDDRKHKNMPYKKTGKININKNLTEAVVNRPEESDNYETVSLPSKGRPYAVSIAVPASILGDTCITENQRIYVVNQVARFATIFGVDEIVVYNDHCWKTLSKDSAKQTELIEMMTTVLQYQECPQYLRRRLCPMSSFLSSAGTLNPLGAPHHLKANQWCPYRDGIVVGRNGKAGSLVDVGLSRNVLVKDMEVPEGARVTVKLPPSARVLNSPCGELVSPQEPRELHGLHWGYTVRVANSLGQVLSECEDSEGYDYLIGTSDRGTPVEDLKVPSFKRALIVFGGVDGLEKCLSLDSTLTANSIEHLFNAYINVCRYQQARTIRTEEAVPLTLAALAPKLQEPHDKP